MREIKFRAWDGKEMLYEGHKKLDHLALTLDGRWVSAADTDLVLALDGLPWPLMQFTGLKDKNGVLIFEGDILKDPKGQHGEVLWHYNSFIVEWDGQERDSSGNRRINRMSGSFTDDCFGYGTVIGNIHEHPSLLEGMKKGV